MMRLVALILVLLGHTPGVYADVFDEDSRRLDLSLAAFGIGFEQSEPTGVSIYSYTSNPRPENEAIEPFPTDLALEGDAVTQLGGDVRRIAITLDDDVAEALSGRRVDMRVWYRPMGTRVTARVVWLSGSVDGQLRRAEPTFFVHNLGQITFQPTGRATSDGWIELATGPVDFEAGAQLAPGYVSFEDANFTDDGIESVVARDPDARAWIDGFSIEDLGEAAVPNARCTAASESVCGDAGLCHLGHCTDGAIYFGAAPQDDELRAAYLDRRAWEIATFNGVRLIASRSDQLSNYLAAADSAVATQFWTGLIRAVNALTDGHSSVPRARATNNVASGACAYRSLADLMPGSPTAPIVWETFAEVPYGTLMRPGDVLVSIDGLAPLEFLELVDREVDYGGDPRAHDVIQTPQLMRFAAQTGSSWEVERCSLPAGCTAAEVERITVDPYPDLQPIWDNAPPSFRFIVPLCDFRIGRLDGEADERAYGFAGTTTDADVEIVMFNGFPPADTGDGQSGWFVTLSAVMQAQPALVLLDQRWGTGGYPDALQRLTDLLLSASDPPFFGETFPSGIVPMGADRSALQNGCANLNCGMYARFGRTPSVDGPAADTKIALLNGYDVSANDFFARRIAVRPGRTRIFGHGPTFGAFGFACNLPPHLPGEQRVGYQCTDTTFSTSLTDPDGVFESGTGVAPDEVVLQRQSDLASGVDTMRQRALEWLREVP